MRDWSDRVVEEANLLNPAFGAVLLAEAVDHYDDKAHHGLPFALAFLVLPIVLHENTRRSLPKTTLTALLPWVQEHRESMVGFSERVRQLQAVSREALLFGLQTEILRIDDQGQVKIGSRRKTVTNKRAPYFTDEVNECVERCGFLGRWFAAAGPTTNIFSAWSVAP
jgi:hypothetical protein